MTAQTAEATLSEKGRAALAYVRLGLAVIPIAPMSKVPHIDGGSTQWTTEADDVTDWWEAHPDDNVAIVTGAPSGNLVVIDCDVDPSRGEDGTETVADWQREHGAWPEGACSTTPRGGEHYLFRLGEVVPNSANAQAGVDVRGRGGYIVAPPSTLANGEYCWDLDPMEYGIPQANESVREFMASLGVTRAHGRNGARFELPEVIREGERNDTLFRYAASLRAKGENEDAILDRVKIANRNRCTVPLPDSELRRLVVHVIEEYDAGRSEEFTQADERRVSVMSMLDRTEKGAVKNTVANCAVILNADPRFAGRWGYDEMAYTKTVELPLPWEDGEGPRPVTDLDYSNFFATVESEYGIRTKEKAIDAIANVCGLHRYSPVADWLRSLEWDGTDRISWLLTTYLGVERTDYTTAVMDLFMRGAVARAFEPGCKFDYMLMLHGAQGIGKSYFLSLLAHDPRWFNDNLNTIDGDAAIEKLRGMWVLEMSELLALKRTQQVESIKSFITSRVDVIRPKYARETERRPRTCVFAGSTNDDSFLSDPTGNRRFLVMDSPLPENQPAEALFSPEAPAAIEQAWAQAVAEWDGGKTELRLPRDMEARAADARAEHEESDPRIGMVQQYLDGVLRVWRDEGKPTPEPRVCAREICERALGYANQNVPQKTINEVNAIVRKRVQGWTKYPNKNGSAVTRNYGTQRCYVPEECERGGLVEQEID